MRLVPSPRGALWLTACLLALVTGCSPALDWREVRVGDTKTLFPCKPDRVARPVALQAGQVPAEMWVCDAGDVTWSATVLPFADAVAAQAALAELHDKLVANVRGQAERAAPVPLLQQASGAVLRRSVLTGQRTSGQALTVDLGVAARGTQAYQWVVLAPVNAPAATRAGVDEFMDSWRWAR